MWPGLEGKKSFEIVHGLKVLARGEKVLDRRGNYFGTRMRNGIKRKGSVKKKDCPSSTARRRYPRAIVRKRRKNARSSFKPWVP